MTEQSKTEEQKSSINFDEIALIKNQRVGNSDSPFGNHAIGSKEAKPKKVTRTDGVTKNNLIKEHVTSFQEGRNYFLYEEEDNKITSVTYIDGKLVDENSIKYNFPDFVSTDLKLVELYKTSPFM